MVHPQNHLMYLVESDHRTFGEWAMREALQKQVGGGSHTNASPGIDVAYSKRLVSLWMRNY
jgi:hypothetical protein